jgi:FMN phosphatase YigB (HAD superfamily)
MMHSPELENFLEGRKVIPEYEAMLEGLDRAGITGLVIDIDDTIIDTDSVYKRRFAEVIGCIASRLKIDYKQAAEAFERANLASFKTHHVNPNKWIKVLQDVALDFGAGNQLHDLNEVLNMIYEDDIEWLYGAREFLWAVRDVGGLKVVGLTNANKEWTRRKAKRCGLMDYMDDIRVVPADKKKSAQDWYWAARSNGLQVEQVMGIGDSINNDIKPMLEAGFGLVVALESPVTSFRGDYPKGVIQARKIGSVPTVLAAYDPS